MSDLQTNSPPSASRRLSMRRWEDAMPWFLTIGSTIVLACIAWFLIENILWFRATAFRNAPMDLDYRGAMFHLHLAMVKRSVGLFSGFALLFLGTAVMLYTLREQSHVEIGTGDWKATIATASPGLIAMLLGVVLLLGTIASKDHFEFSHGKANTVGDGPMEEPATDTQSTTTSGTTGTQKTGT